MAVEVASAAPERFGTLAAVFGRAFIAEPMMRWPLGEPEDAEAWLIRAFETFLRSLGDAGVVWEAGDAVGALVLIPPDRRAPWEEAQVTMRAIYADGPDGARRYDAFWDWVESREPDEPLALLDSVAVEPAAQGRGIGSALIEFGLARARAGGYGVMLETGNPRNVPLYERHGFRVTDAADAPMDGPRIWFMRWDP
jgi:GNAT superfamily N-acetyltransferase